MRSYLQHGRRHAIGGTDPIPGLSSGASGLSWAYQAGPITATTVPMATNKVIARTAATGFFTNDSSLFSQGTAVVGGTTYYGIQVIGTKGLYLTWATLVPGAQIGGGIQYGIEIANANDPSEADLNMGFTSRVAASTDLAQNVNWIQLGTQTGSAQTHAMLFQADNLNSVGSYTALLQVFCVCLDSKQSTYVG